MKPFFTDTTPPEFTVSEITNVLQNLLHETFYNIRVRGEISGLTRSSAGHTYLTLKDNNAIINAVCWNNTRLKNQFCNGIEVICTGYVTTYQSKYQLIIENLELAGPGAIAAMLEERKKRLAAEGLFDPSLKRKLPLLPLTIGVITSPTGAVIHDIINRVKSRFPSHILLWPVQVQGEKTCNMVINAIAGFNNMANAPDVIIIARGGGSIEDLLPFQDEQLARAAARSKIPIVSAVGHETDFSILDYVADVRAPTPTAAVEIVLPEKHALVQHMATHLARARGALEKVVNAHENRILRLLRILIEAKHQILHKCSTVLQLQKKIQMLLQITVMQKKQHLDELKHRLERYDKTWALKAGYAIVCDATGNKVVNARGLAAEEIITIEWHDGTRRALILPD